MKQESLPVLELYVQQQEQSAAKMAMKLAAIYRRMGQTQAKALTEGWQDARVYQEMALQGSAEHAENVWGQLMQRMMQQAQAVAAAVAGLLGLKKTEDAAEKVQAQQKQVSKALATTRKQAASTMLALDELNVVSGTATSGGSSGASSGSSSPGQQELEEVKKQQSEVEKGWARLWALAGQLAQLFEPAVKSWQKAWSSLKQGSMDALEQMGQSLGDLWNRALMPLAAYFVGDWLPGIVNGFSVVLAPIVAQVGTAFMTHLAGGFGLACQMIETLMNTVLMPLMDLILQVVLDVLDGVANAWATYGEPVLKAIGEGAQRMGNLVKGVYEDVILPVIWDLMEHVEKLWSAHLKPLWDRLALLFGAVAQMCLQVWNNGVMPLLESMKNIFGPVVQKVLGCVADTFFGLLGVACDVLAGIVRSMEGLCNFVSGVFSGNWAQAWNGIVEIFLGIWEGVTAAFRGVIGGLVSMVNAFLSGFVDGFNVVSDLVNSIRLKVSSWVPGVGGESFGFNMPRLPSVQIPALARGAVLPANKPFLAMVGDQKRGTNVEAPLDTIKQALAEVLAQVGGQELTASQPIEVTLDGQVLYRAMSKIQARQGRRIGGAFADAY